MKDLVEIKHLCDLMKKKNYDQLVSTLLNMDSFPNRGNRREFFDFLESDELMVLWSQFVLIPESKPSRFGPVIDYEHHKILHEIMQSLDSKIKLKVSEKARLWKSWSLDKLIKYLVNEVFDLDKSLRYLIEELQSVVEILEPNEISALKEYFITNCKDKDELTRVRLVVFVLTSQNCIK